MSVMPDAPRGTALSSSSRAVVAPKRRRGWTIPLGTWLLLAPVLAASVIVVGLLGFVLWISFSRMTTGSPAGFDGIANYRALFADPVLWLALANTLKFTALTLVIAFGFGLPLAWLVERTDLPGRSFIWTMVLASLLMPGFLLAMGWLFLAHPRIGFVNSFLMDAFHLTDAPFPINNVAGMGLVQGIALTPLVFILMAPSLRMLDVRMEEAGRMGGATTWGVLRSISAPLMLPAFLAAAIYTAISAFGAFDVPAIIGLSNRVYVFSTFMYVLAYPSTGFPDYTRMAAAGGLMIVIALGLSLFYVRFLRQARRYQVVSGKGYRAAPVRLGLWTFSAWLFAGSYILLGVGLPFVLTLVLSLLPYPQPLSFDALSHITLDNFRHIPWQLLSRGLIHTFELAVVVPVLVVGFSVAFSWIVLRTRIRFRFVFDAIAFLPHAVPGILFAVGAMLMALFVLRRFVPIYGTVAMIMLVYVVAWLSLGTRVINASLMQIDAELEEAGQIAGAATAGVLRRIILPLLRPATSGLWIFVVLLCLRELTLAAFVSTPQNITLPLVIWIQWTAGNLDGAAALAVILTLILSPLLFLYLWLRRGGESVF
jgi:iron(III) transport system permease protein